MAARRVICYIDGFNLYHAIAALHKPHLKWVNLHALAGTLIKHHQTLVATKYFSAYATWRSGAFQRHSQYTKALQACGVEVIIAHFKEKNAGCRSCGATWTEHEEKETDVHLALQLVIDAEDNAADDFILITADSDFVPPVRLVQRRHPDKRLVVAAPPGRFSYGRSLQQQANSYFAITKGRIRQSLLGKNVMDGSGNVVAVRPRAYEPPP